MSQTIIGLDIGNSELKMAAVAGDRIKRLAVEPLPNNLVRDGRIISMETMSQVLRDALRKHKVRGKKCAVSFPAELAFTRRLTMPLMTTDQLQLNLPFEFHDYIQSDKERYVYDYAVIDYIRDEQGQVTALELLAVAAPREVVDNYRRMLRKAGLKMVLAMPENCAYSNIIRRYERLNPEHPQEYCIIDMGYSAVRLHMFTNSTYQTSRVGELGGAALDQAIADALAVDEFVASGYKLADLENAQNLEACQERYARIAVDIQRALNFYAYNNPDRQLRDVYFSGGLSKIRPLMDVVCSELDAQMHGVEALLAMKVKDSSRLSLCTVAIGVAMTTPAQ